TQRWPVLHVRRLAMAFHARQVHQQGGAAAAFDEGADRRPTGPDDQIALPMSVHRPVIGLGRTLGQDHISGDMPLRLVARTSPRCSQRPTGAQTGDQFALERAAPLDEQRLVDRLVADAHGLIIGEVDLQTLADLLRAPCPRPATIRPAGLVQALPCRWCRAVDERAVRSTDAASEPLLDVLPQPVVLDELRGLGTLRSLLSLPLRHHRPVLLLPAPGRGVAAQLTRDRPSVT